MTELEKKPEAKPSVAEALAAKANAALGERANVTKPKLISAKHVLFYSAKANLGASTPTGVVRFTDHWAQTDDPVQIESLKANAKHFGISVA